MSERKSEGRSEQFRKLFIGGLPPSTTEETLKEYFSKWGEIVDAVVMKDSHSGRSRGFGFVTYSEPEMVDAAQSNRPHELDGKVVESKRAMPREESHNSESHQTVKKLYVGGLKKEITSEDLREYFSKFGNIVDCEVVKMRETNVSRGFGFVTFDDYDAVDKVLLYKPHTIKSSHSDVKKALSREEMNNYKRRYDNGSRYGPGYNRDPYYGPHHYDPYQGYDYPPRSPMGGYHDYWDSYPPSNGWNNGMGDGFGQYGNQGYGGGPMRNSGNGYQRNQPYYSRR